MFPNDVTTTEFPVIEWTTNRNEAPTESPAKLVPDNEMYDVHLEFLFPDLLVAETGPNLSNTLNWTVTANGREESRNNTESFDEFATPSKVTLRVLNFNATTNITINGTIGAEVSEFSESAIQGKGFLVDMHAVLQNNVTSATLSRDFRSAMLYTTPPITNLSLHSPQIAIGHREMLEVVSHLNKGQVNPVYVMKMPFDKEPQLTVTNMQMSKTGDDVTVTSTQGSKDFRSSESWTRTDLGRWKSHSTYVVKTEGEVTNRTVNFVAEIRMEDLKDTTNDTVTWVGAGVHYGGDILWVGQVPVRSVVQWPRRPHLEVVPRYGGYQYSASNSHNLRYEVSISHTENSTSYAHDFTMTLYLMPLLQRVSIRGTSHIKSYSKAVHGNILKFVINRVLFSDNAKIQFEVKHPQKEYSGFDYYVCVVEMEYCFIDGNLTQIYESPLAYARNKISAKWPQDPDPICHCIPGNTSSGICPCCPMGDLSCGVDAPGVCVPRGMHELCKAAHSEHWKTTQLIDGNDYYVCNYGKAWMFDSLYSSFVQWEPRAMWHATSPQLGTILGQHVKTGEIFGTGNNGISCVMSRDKRMWFSLDCASYETAKASGHWKTASKISISNEKPLFSRDIGAFSWPSEDPGCLKQEVNVPGASCDSLDAWNALGDVAVDATQAQDGARSFVVNPPGGNFSQNISISDLAWVKTRLEAHSKCQRVPCTATGYSMFLKAGEKIEYFHFNKHSTGWQRGQIEMFISNNTRMLEIGAISHGGVDNVHFDSFKLALFSDLGPVICLV